MKTITEKKLKNIISKIVKENISNYPKIYHQTPFNINNIISIYLNGLIPHDNTEANGIWFSKNEPFYNNDNLVCFSMIMSPKIIEKYNIDTNDNIIIIHDKIQFSDLLIENIPFAIANNNPIYTNAIPFFKKMSEKKNYNNIAEYIVNNKQLMQNNIIIFKDIYQSFVENNTLNVFINNNNIILKNLFT